MLENVKADTLKHHILKCIISISFNAALIFNIDRMLESA